MSFCIKNIILLFLITVLKLGFLQGQAAIPAVEDNVEQRDFNRKRWAEVTDGLDYSRDRLKPKKKKEDQNGSGRDRNRVQLPNWGDGSAVMKILIIIIAGIVLFILLRLLLGLNSPRNRKIKHKVVALDIDKIEENLYESDLEEYIQQAIAGGNFALAVRLYYLEVLKTLSLANTIKWKKDKTNRDYLTEMLKSSLYKSFTEITFIFERIWYGDNAISYDEFKLIEPMFKRFIYQINKQSMVSAS